MVGEGDPRAGCLRVTEPDAIVGGGTEEMSKWEVRDGVQGAIRPRAAEGDHPAI
jgi:hypothetical protein